MIAALPSSEYFLPSDMNLWWKDNKSKLVFESDRLKVKNFDEFPKMFECYKEYTKDGQLKTFLKLRQGGDSETYDKIYSDVMQKLYYFGRYSIFMYLETIYNLTKFPIMATGLNLREARTSRNGLCYAIGKDDWVQAKLSKRQFEYLQLELKKLYTEILSEYPEVPTTYWNLETSLCAYYKLFRAKRYVGYYIDRQMQEIEKMQNLIPNGANWDLLWKFRREHFDVLSLGEIQGWHGIRKNMMNYFLQTGIYTEHKMRSKDYASQKV